MAKRGRKKKVTLEDAVAEMAKQEEVQPEVAASEPEEMTEAEAEGVIERAAERKEEAKKVVLAAVDVQDWSLADPVIPDDLKGRVWVSVYRCPAGHKTKATNRQADSGVLCWQCKQPAEIMPQFLTQGKAIDPTVARNKVEKDR